MKKVIMLGGGGFAGEVLDTIEYINKNTKEKILPLGYVCDGAAKDIGNDVFLGVRATILKARIGDRSVVGACALITKDMPQNMMAKGIPAKYYEMDEKKY